MRLQRISAALLLALGAASPAAAQAWIGAVVGNMIAQQQETACMSGTPMAASEIEEGKAAARSVMDSYWAAVRGGKPADISAVYHGSDSDRWVLDTVPVKGKGLMAVTDPFAAATAPDAKPDLKSFQRAGDFGSARAIFTISQPDGVAKNYLFELKRKVGAWRATRIELFNAAEAVPELTQYCHRPGDVDEYKAQIAAYEAKRQAKREEKETRARLAAERAAAGAQR